MGKDFSDVAKSFLSPVTIEEKDGTGSSSREYENALVQTGPGRKKGSAYKYALGRELKPLTTRICVDNIDFLYDFALSEGVRGNGALSYALNRIIEDKRGITEVLRKSVDVKNH